MQLRALVVITNADGAIGRQALGPEAFQRSGTG